MSGRGYPLPKSPTPFWHYFIALLLATVGAAQAQALKIGNVHLERVLSESDPGRAAHAKLRAEFGRREKDIDAAALALKKSADKFEQESQNLSESERTKRQRELILQDRDLQRKHREFQHDLNQRRNEELAGLIDRANRTIRQVFDAERYDLIVQDSNFAGPHVDITDKVIKLLNASGAPATSGK
jgi:outer membrane protein